MTPGSFNLIVCNPPYVRHHHIANGDKLRLQETAQKSCGVSLSGLAGLYCHFIAIAQLNNTPLETLLGEGRVYGGGLHKLEPKELGNVSAEPLLDLIARKLPPLAYQMDIFELMTADS